jgi:hypothetical protein
LQVRTQELNLALIPRFSAYFTTDKRPYNCIRQLLTFLVSLSRLCFTSDLMFELSSEVKLKLCSAPNIGPHVTQPQLPQANSTFPSFNISKHHRQQVNRTTYIFLRHKLKPLRIGFEMEPATRTRFDDLPPELRQKIWSLILPGPRLVTVNHFSKAPLALHINRESRFIALKHYELLHPQHLEHAKHTNGHRCVKGYIDFEVDIIHMAVLMPVKILTRRSAICRITVGFGNISRRREHF